MTKGNDGVNWELIRTILVLGTLVFSILALVHSSDVSNIDKRFSDVVKFSELGDKTLRDDIADIKHSIKSLEEDRILNEKFRKDTEEWRKNLSTSLRKRN